MDTPTLLNLADSLHRLVYAPEEQREAAYQAWFEENQSVFHLLHYRRAIPHPFCVGADEGLHHIPDFLAERLDGLWEVFELKRPDTEVMKNDRGRRIRFYDEFESYWAQCREYSKFLRDSRNRKDLRDKYGITVQSEVSSVIVASKTDGMDRAKLHELLSDRGAMVSLRTYDDIINVIRSTAALQDNHLAGLEGITLSVVLNLLPRGATMQQVLFDFGSDSHRNRITIGFIGTSTCFAHIRDHGGKLHDFHVPLPLDINPIERSFHLHVEFGTSQVRSFITVFINGRCLLHNAFAAIEIRKENLDVFTIGTDVSATTSAAIEVAEDIAYRRTLGIEERLQLMEYFASVYKHHLGESGIYLGLPNRVSFEGKRWMHSKGHPCHDPKQAENRPMTEGSILFWHMAEFISGPMESLDQCGEKDHTKSKPRVGPPGFEHIPIGYKTAKRL